MIETEALIALVVVLSTLRELLGNPIPRSGLQAVCASIPADVRVTASQGFAAASLIRAVLRIVPVRGVTSWANIGGAMLDETKLRRPIHQSYAVRMARHTSALFSAATSWSHPLVQGVLIERLATTGRHPSSCAEPRP
jgi:hypothetical protein